MLIFNTSFVLAETKTYEIDLDNDGKAETITTEDKVNTDIQFVEECVITVTSADKKYKDSFSIPEHIETVKFVSLNKDGNKQIVATSTSGMHYTNIAVYSYKDSKLHKIFESGSGCAIETDFESSQPNIKVGIAKLDQEGWSYADEPNWEIWLWDGKKFVKEK